MYNYIILLIIIVSLVWVIKAILTIRDLKNELKERNEQRTNSNSIK